MKRRGVVYREYQRDQLAWTAGRWVVVIAACWIVLVGLVTLARGDTATDIGTGFGSSNAAGQITAGLLDLDDPNLHDTPEIAKVDLRENHVDFSPDLSCANNGTDGRLTWLDANESASANSWTECYELKTGRTIFTGSDGSVLAAVTYDSSGNAVRIELWAQGSGVDQASAATVGTIAWAEAAIVAGGTIYLHPGSYYISTPDSIVFNQAGVTLAGSNRSGAILIANGAGFDGAMIETGFTGSQLDNVSIRDLEFNGNKGNVTGSIAIHARDTKFSFLNLNIHDCKTGGVLADSTVSTIVKARILDSKFFNFTAGAYGIKTSDDATGCLTDVVINRNEMGAAPIVIDECINGIQIEHNHLYGYLTDQACLQATVTGARYDWRIADNTIEDCGREAITISGGGADRGTIANNTFYANGRTTDATYSAISLSGVDSTVVEGNIVRAAAGGGSPGQTLHGIALSSASSNNRIIGNQMIGTSALSDTVSITGGSGNTVVANSCNGTCNYAAALASAGTDLVALNYCSGTCTGHVSDTIATDLQFNPDATYGWLMKDGIGILPDGTNGVSVNGTTGVLAKVGTGSVQADDVACTGCVSGADVALTAAEMPSGTNTTTWTVDADNTGGSEPATGAGFKIEGGSGDVSALYNATDNTLDLAGAAGGYTFDGPLVTSGADGSRGATFTDNTSEPSAPVAGKTLLYALAGELYKKDNGDGTSERLLLTDANIGGDFTCTQASQAATCSIGSDKITSGMVAFNYAGSSSEGGAATSATALAANGANCSAGSFPLGVDASGAAESCTAVGFTAAGTSGSGQTISNGDTLTIAAGTGITTTGGATDTVTVASTLGTAIDTTEITDGTITYADVNNTQTLAGNPTNGDNSVWIGTTGLIFEGATSDTVETLLTAADPTSSDKTITLPNETGTVCTTGSVCSGYQAGPLSGDVVTSGAAATIQANSVALGTDTTNNYVATVAASNTGIAVSGSGSETAAVTVGLAYSNTLAGDPALGAGECTFASGASERGVVCEGATADTVEIALAFPDPASTDKTVTLPNATDTLVGKATTDVFTNKTLDATDATNVLTTTEAIWLPMGGCNGATASPFWNLPAANAPAITCGAGTNTINTTADFDATTDESAQTTVMLPADWTGAIDVTYKWRAAATSGSVAWCTQLICVADAETADPSFPAQASGNCVTDAAKGTTLQMNDVTDTGITATGCAAGELMFVRVSRDPDETAGLTDTMSGDAQLAGVMLLLRRAQ